MSVAENRKRTMATDDSLEYFIKFPTANSRENNGKSDDDVFVHNEKNVPVVLLLGWAGCQDKHLMKYSKIYEDRGLITIRYTAPVENIFFKREAMKPIGEKLAKLIYDMKFDAHPLIFHVFSNGGAFLYQHIWLAFQKLSPTVQIRAVIFDSAPGNSHMTSLYRAISAIYGQRPLNTLVTVLITFSLMVIWTVVKYVNKLRVLLNAGAPAQAFPYEGLKLQDCHAPQLFLYSKNDKLIPFADVEAFAACRKSRGIQVQLVRFESEHVKLYSSQPDRYVQSICKFVNDCLANSKVSNKKD